MTTTDDIETERALMALRSLGSDARGYSVSRVARKAGLWAPIARELLARAADRGLAVRVEETGRWRA